MVKLMIDLIEFIYPGEPIPATRPRRSDSGGMFTPEPYRSYKEALAEALYLNFRQGKIPLPPTSVPYERQKYIKKNRYSLSVKVYRSKNVGDVDNYYKCISDAIQDSGLIVSDSQIDECYCIKLIDKVNPRIELELKRL